MTVREALKVLNLPPRSKRSVVRRALARLDQDSKRLGWEAASASSQARRRELMAEIARRHEAGEVLRRRLAERPDRPRPSPLEDAWLPARFQQARPNPEPAGSRGESSDRERLKTALDLLRAGPGLGPVAPPPKAAPESSNLDGDRSAPKSSASVTPREQAAEKSWPAPENADNPRPSLGKPVPAAPPSGLFANAGPRLAKADLARPGSVPWEDETPEPSPVDRGIGIALLTLLLGAILTYRLPSGHFPRAFGMSLPLSAALVLGISAAMRGRWARCCGVVATWAAAGFLVGGLIPATGGWSAWSAASQTRQHVARLMEPRTGAATVYLEANAARMRLAQYPDHVRELEVAQTNWRERLITETIAECKALVDSEPARALMRLRELVTHLATIGHPNESSGQIAATRQQAALAFLESARRAARTRLLSGTANNLEVIVREHAGLLEGETDLADVKTDLEKMRATSAWLDELARQSQPSMR